MQELQTRNRLASVFSESALFLPKLIYIIFGVLFRICGFGINIPEVFPDI